MPNDDDDRSTGKIIMRGKPEVLGERPLQLPQILHGLQWARSRAFRLRGSAQYMAKTYYLHCTESDSLQFYRSVNQERMRIVGLDTKKRKEMHNESRHRAHDQSDEVFLNLAASTAQM